MTTEQVAKALGIHRSRVLRLIKDGRLKAEKRGRDWWIEDEALDAVKGRKNGRPKKTFNGAWTPKDGDRVHIKGIDTVYTAKPLDTEHGLAFMLTDEDGRQEEHVYYDFELDPDD